LSASDWAYLGTESARLTAKYPLSSISEVNATYTTWDDESLEIAESFVYTGITENTLPSDAYLKAGIDIAERQIVKGGYRLALLLETWWGASSAEEPAKTSVELFTEFLE
jgi:hypothetical protein